MPVALRPGTAEFNIGHVAAFVSTVVFAHSLLLLRRAKAAESDKALIATLLVVMTPLSLLTALSSTGLSAMDFNHTGIVVMPAFWVLPATCYWCGPGSVRKVLQIH
ncbi:hypothetical protein N2600_03635 [Rhizobium sp. WSM1274]|uniref:hypothetical protein n=1 Tax=Rhizobium sp. WSM1274 TaxID=3138254 RepID=UPI0021A46653|nr:hypothetical protein [Rhizobium leguminosarum]UWU29077.1 hypothetical protein N2600_03635 [Rhizobium leguminosarum bv. viciae]